MSASRVSLGTGIELSALPAPSPSKPLTESSEKVKKAALQHFHALLDEAYKIKKGDDLTAFVDRLEAFHGEMGGADKDVQDAVNEAYQNAKKQSVCKERPANTKTQASGRTGELRATGGYKKSSHGLPNLGITCFANSAFQLLFNTPGIDEVLSQGISITTDSPDRIEFRKNLKALKDEYNKGLRNQSKVRELLRLLQKSTALPPTLRERGRQQDAGEFLLAIYDILNEDGHPHFQLPVSSMRVNPANPREIVLARDVNRESIQLSISAERPTLQGCLDGYLAPEQIPTLRTADHPDCTNKQLFFKGEAPETIQFGLNRFTADNRKIKTRINGIDQPLHIPFCNDLGVVVSTAAYEVDAVVCHEGISSNAGHYYTLLRTPNGWRELNDSRERLLSHEEGLAIVEKYGYLVKARKV